MLEQYFPRLVIIRVQYRNRKPYGHFKKVKIHGGLGQNHGRTRIGYGRLPRWFSKDYSTPTEAIAGLLQTKNTLSFSKKDQEGRPDAAATGLLEQRMSVQCLPMKDSQENTRCGLSSVLNFWDLTGAHLLCTFQSSAAKNFKERKYINFLVCNTGRHAYLLLSKVGWRLIQAKPQNPPHVQNQCLPFSKELQIVWVGYSSSFQIVSGSLLTPKYWAIQCEWQ